MGILHTFESALRIRMFRNSFKSGIGFLFCFISAFAGFRCFFGEIKINLFCLFYEVAGLFLLA